jgi:hypothetical protein
LALLPFPNFPSGTSLFSPSFKVLDLPLYAVGCLHGKKDIFKVTAIPDDNWYQALWPVSCGVLKKLAKVGACTSLIYVVVKAFLRRQWLPLKALKVGCSY